MQLKHGQMNKKDKTELHPNREKVIIRLAKLQGITAAKYDDLPGDLRLFYSHFKYVDLIRPLLSIDRERGMSYGQLAVKYQVTKRTIEWNFCCAPRFFISEEE